MLEAVDSMMMELQRALLAQLIYPAGRHVQACQARACEMVLQILEHRQKVDVFVLDDRVIFDDTTLPSSANLIKGLFSLLLEQGVDRITFQRGLDIEEIQLLLDELAACKAEESRQMQATAHITFSYIREFDTSDSTQLASRQLKRDGAEMAAVVSDLWQDIDENKDFNSNLFTDIVTSILRTVSDSSNAMLPLLTIKRHDEYTFMHSINVAILSATFCESLGFDNTGIQEMCMAALLHDIGKRNIPKEILNKKGRLTDEETQLIQMHPVEGARMLLVTPEMPELASIVAYEHHVSADGSGYPKAPKGWKLSFASRIVQVVDVFDALRTHRPYRRGLSVPQIHKIVRGDMSACFDADLLDVFFQQIIPRYNPDPTVEVEV
ncbi:HD-GYP domain-containing protein [Planctomycetota bacterium]